MTDDNNCEKIRKESKCSVQHLNDLEYILFVRDGFDKKLFPNDFDKWTVREQCVWINENIATFFPHVPQSLVNLIPASFHELNHDLLTEKPAWLDMNKYLRGRKFVNDHYGSVVISQMFSLVQSFSFDHVLKPIIISKHFDSPYLVFKRCLSTLERLLSWYNEEPWIKGTAAYKNMQYTRKLHLLLRKQLRQLTNKQIDNMTKIAEPWCPDRELLLKDFAAACPFQKIDHRPHITLLNHSSYKPKGINNADFAITQCSFISMIVLYPQHVGVHDATDEDLEAYCHMWRCYGYCLGMDDEYNFCRGSLDEIKQRTRDMYENEIIHNLKDITPEWEHMTRCLIESTNYYPFICMPYKAMTLVFTDILRLNMPNLYASLTYKEWIVYKGWTFLLRQALKISVLRYSFNKILHKVMHAAMNLSLEKEMEIQEHSNNILKRIKATNGK